MGTGVIELPCVPSMLEPYVSKLSAVFAALGKPFSEEELEHLRNAVRTELERGYSQSPYSRLSVRYETHKPPHPGIQYFISAIVLSLEQVYTQWGQGQTAPLFGRLPDAKVTALAEGLGDPKSSPILDVGAGIGRNSIPLAKLGHPTTALEPVESMANQIRETAAAENLPLDVVQGSIFSPDVALKSGHYKLAVVAEVTSHFQRLDEMRTLFAKLADTLAPGGLALVSAFLTSDGYKPDELARQAALALWSMMFTRAELAFLTQELPFDKVSDESMLDYEKEHLPPEGWPPTSWYEAWAQGNDVFALPIGKAPIEHRWLTYRRK
jgi:2-polyprenyl-3-methyl-5-hydroxy-6-metoxy-1,4-benzoquinol methylase